MGRVLAVAGAVAVSLGVPGAAQAAAKTCPKPDYPGAGYYQFLKVTGVTCERGTRVVAAYTRCRREKALDGRCGHKVQGYACSERRQSIPTEIDALVTCTKGDKRVVHYYQQNLT